MVSARDGRQRRQRQRHPSARLRPTPRRRPPRGSRPARPAPPVARLPAPAAATRRPRVVPRSCHPPSSRLSPEAFDRHDLRSRVMLRARTSRTVAARFFEDRLPDEQDDVPMVRGCAPPANPFHGRHGERLVRHADLSSVPAPASVPTRRKPGRTHRGPVPSRRCRMTGVAAPYLTASGQTGPARTVPAAVTASTKW